MMKKFVLSLAVLMVGNALKANADDMAGMDRMNMTSNQTSTDNAQTNTDNNMAGMTM